MDDKNDNFVKLVNWRKRYGVCVSVCERGVVCDLFFLSFAGDESLGCLLTSQDKSRDCPFGKASAPSSFPPLSLPLFPFSLYFFLSFSPGTKSSVA